MTINERFETIIKILFNGNKRAFALHIGVSPTVVENVVGTRRGKPSFDFLEKVCANANISAEWLLMGKGEMLMDMFEFRKTPMVFHSDPERYVEDKDDKSDEVDTPPISSNSDSKVVQDKEANEMLLRLLKDKDESIGNLREEVGRLKERIAQLEREKNDSSASYQTAPRELSKSPVDL